MSSRSRTHRATRKTLKRHRNASGGSSLGPVAWWVSMAADSRPSGRSKAGQCRFHWEGRPIKALSVAAALVGSGGEDLAAGVEGDGLGGLVCSALAAEAAGTGGLPQAIGVALRSACYVVGEEIQRRAGEPLGSQHGTSSPRTVTIVEPRS